uniref:Telomere-associated protein RIF1-like n=1 Tax=Sinocyclocheilus anshuiensis TaxID=1608454 RepID=A0A671K3Q8_9TELE
MAAVPLSSASLLPLLKCLEDEAAGLSEKTDAYITIMNIFFFQVHISSENEELCQAALQALGFCVFHSHIVSVLPANISEDILSTLCNVVVKSKEKFTCTRALWVISKQNFPPEVASKKTPEILKSLEAMQTREVQSILIEHESLNVIIRIFFLVNVRLLEQAPSQMAAGAVCWAKLVIPLVVHSANRVRLRAAAALELGMPLLLEKQQEVATIVEPMMSSMLIPEMQKLFASKNETNMLKLWPLFVRLLGKLLHKGGAFINSLLYLEELGFRNSSPNIKKIAFIAWKSLIDNFALNPDILCSSKRLKLLMQPLSSIQVRTEALLLTKLEVWWYLAVKLGPNLSANFEQVGVPLLHNTLPSDSPLPSIPSCSTPSTTPRMNLNSSMQAAQSYRSIQLLGLEMLLHWLVGPEVTVTAARENLQLSLEPLTHPLFISPSSFSRHASTLISAIKEGFITVGKHAPEALLSLIWSNLILFLSTGNKKERQGSEVLTLLLQALQSILSSDDLPAECALLLLEATVKGIPQKVLGSAAYQVANMDVLNGTPALFLILLFYKSNQLSSFLEDERFFSSLETLVSCGFYGPTSPLAFGEAVLGAISGRVEAVKNKKQLWRMWSAVVNPLTDTITQTNEVNQGDALEHNFSAICSALMFPVIHLLPGSPLPQTTQKAMIGTWSRLYKAFARCSALVATAEENICCEELCAKISASLDTDALKNLPMLDAMANILLVIIESMDFSPYTPQFQQKMKSPHTPLSWVRKRSKALGNLSTFHTLLMQTLDAFLSVDLSEASVESTSGVFSGIGLTLVSILSTLFTNITLPTFIQEVLSTLTKPLTCLFEQFSSHDEPSKLSATLGPKLEKLVTDLLGCLQMQSTLHDDEMLAMLSPLLCVLFPHKSKQIRTVVTQFWNATFGNALTLTYPEPLEYVFMPLLGIFEPTTDVKLTQEGTGSVVETPEKATQNKDKTSEKNQSPSRDISVDVSGHEKSGLEGTSPNVSGSSEMISGTPPKPNRRRQSFITLEKYVDGKSPSPASVAFTGPHIRKSSRLSSSKALEATPNDSQLQTTKEDSRKRSSTDPSAQNEEVKDKMSTGHCGEGTDEEEDDVVPDIQTQLSGDTSGDKKIPVSKASVEEQDSPEKDSQSLADSQASQEPRRSGRRRSKPVRPGEDPGEMKSRCQEQVADSAVTNTQKHILSPTISILTGRSTVIEDRKFGDQLNTKGIKGELSQSNSQISSAESSQTLPQVPIFMLGNKEPSQTVSSSDSSPVTQSDGQSKKRSSTLNESEGLSPGRPMRKTRAHLEESTDKEADENSQNDPHNAASTLKKKHSQTPLSDSEVDGQQTARTRRTRRSESQLLELAGSQTKDDLSQRDSQTLTMVKGRAMRRRTAEEETDYSIRDATSTVNAEELSASQDSSEGLGRYRTRRSKGLLAPTDNTESENSDSRQDGPRPKKRPRKTLSTEMLPVATEHIVTEMGPDKEGVDVSMEMSQDEADIETSLNILITSEKEAEDVKIQIELKTETYTDEKEVIGEKAEGEELNSSLQIGSEDLNEKTNVPHKCPHTRGRGRGRRRSRSCNCFSNNCDMFSQGSDFQESQDLKSEQVPLVTDTLNSQPEQSSSTSVAEKSENTQIDNRDPPVDPQEEMSVPPESSTSGACLDSPPKHKPLDALSGELEPGQSPSRNRSSVWSPSASPSTSILKKGQKRTCEEDTPSPLHKSRRVSFATPIYHQELADDIDRRSPVIRTSSPRSKVLSGQSKYITTPTKGYTSLSPRNLHSPGSKSSKKCLISEMSQEPRPIAKDCVYPALVGCSTPVEAVLPQISSNMWPRGFGQLVRARNIKTVGDLSALTPSEIKSLPIRSSKLSNVRKALKTYYEQQVIVYLALVSSPLLWEIISYISHLAVQRKGSSDDLKNVEALSGHLTSEELGRCSPNQLGLMHEHLSGMMRSIVTHMQSCLLSNLDDSLP